MATFVEEGNVSRSIFMLRKALGETDQDRYIVTVPGRGYRFAQNVHLLTEQDLTMVAASHSRVQMEIKETKPWQWLAGSLIFLLVCRASWWIVHRKGATGKRAALGEKDTVVTCGFRKCYRRRCV